MVSGTCTSSDELTASAVLAAARRARAEADAAEAALLAHAVAWAAAHEVGNERDAACWGDSPLPLAGPGAPLVSEFCVPEFGAALGQSTDAARSLIGHALELRHRLPRVWESIHTGLVPAWRGRRIAERTLGLSPDAAAFVDEQVVGFAHRVGPAAVERLVEEAIVRFMPERAAEEAKRRDEQRYLLIHHDQVSFAGTSRLDGELDLVDALDLESAIQRIAARLADTGCAEALEVRRSMALGLLARGEELLPLEVGAARAGREVSLVVHIARDALGEPSSIGRVEAPGLGGLGAMVSSGQLDTWLSSAGKVTIQPVIDLAEQRVGSGYDIPDRLRQQVVLRDRHCVFPWCTRTSRSADLDHTRPYAEAGATASDNLAPLCRRHHRLKTHPDGQGRRWTYRVEAPGEYLWVSPRGLRYRVERGFTESLTPRPVAPPAS